jgi:hypothetical protein
MAALITHSAPFLPPNTVWNRVSVWSKQSVNFWIEEAGLANTRTASGRHK